MTRGRESDVTRSGWQEVSDVIRPIMPTERRECPTGCGKWACGLQVTVFSKAVIHELQESGKFFKFGF